MPPMIPALISALIAVKADRRNYAQVARAFGGVPLGDGNGKTGSPGTYRPVGPTCPQTCPFLDRGCYAQGGRVALVERRASPSVAGAVVSALAIAVWARRTGRDAGRLHVSGDLGSTREEVDAYASALIEGFQELRSRGAEWDGVLLWGYTRSPHARPWLDKLRSVGIVLRRSGYHGPGGAIVTTDIARSRAESSATVARCPAQSGATTCAKCKMCWERPGLVIAFEPEGTGVRATVARGNAS